MFSLGQFRCRLLYVSVADFCKPRANSIHSIFQSLGYQKIGVEIKCLGTRSQVREKIDFWSSLYGINESCLFILYFFPFQKFRLIYLAVRATIVASVYDFDVIYTRNFWFAVLLLVFKRLKFHQKFVYEFHNFNKQGEFLLKYFGNQANVHFVFISARLRELYVERVPGKLHNTIIIEHDASISFTELVISHKMLDRKKAMLDGLNSPLVGFFGSIDEGRGYEIILHLAKTFSECSFICWGYSQGIEKYHAPSNLFVMEQVPYPLARSLMLDMDALIMPYTYGTRVVGEGQPTAEYMSPLKMFDYLEGSAAIFSSDIPVLREVLTDEIAYFCAVHDLCDWERKFGHWLCLFEERSDSILGAHNRAREALFGKHTWTNRGLRILNEIGV